MHADRYTIRTVPDVVIFGDTLRVPELRHEVPIGIGDPFLYLERDGVKHIVIGSLDLPRVRELPGLEAHALQEFGVDELVEQGLRPLEIRLETTLRAVRELGVARPVVPVGFPLAIADRLRSEGIELEVDEDYFDDRRRVKNEAELAGIRRAQRAAEAGMDAARDLLRSARGNGDGLRVDGEPLTVERVKRPMSLSFLEQGTTADEFIVSHGPQSAVGHHMGAGPIRAGEPIVIDVWPRDNESACFADMTRTYVVGEARGEIVEWHRLCLEALEHALDDIKAGVPGRSVYDATCDIFEREGYPTGRTKEPGVVLEDGFFHGLGHGVGLEVHEAPGMGIASQKDLVRGDVVTVEPGLYRPGYGGCRLEDLVLVTENGAENLTHYPYDLEP